MIFSMKLYSVQKGGSLEVGPEPTQLALDHGRWNPRLDVHCCLSSGSRLKLPTSLQVHQSTASGAGTGQSPRQELTELPELPELPSPNASATRDIIIISNSNEY
jgi:hypothetical protein